MREIIPGQLWIGPHAELEHPTQILNVGIEAVMAVAPEIMPSVWPRNLILHRIPLTDDGENSPARLRLAVDTLCGLLSEGIPTSVTCSAGLSRSPAVAAVAMARLEGRSAEAMLVKVTSGTADVSPALWESLMALAES